MKMVLELSESEKNKMIEKAQTLVRKYSWKKTAQETLNIYESSLGL
jgi:glycosyltransferase involved in cell wall biosynthesis